ncbi:MAG: hypothetical protein ABI977_02850 [Acidobacteriota bacterium]
MVADCGLSWPKPSARGHYLPFAAIERHAHTFCGSKRTIRHYAHGLMADRAIR